MKCLLFSVLPFIALMCGVGWCQQCETSVHCMSSCCMQTDSIRTCQSMNVRGQDCSENEEAKQRDNPESVFRDRCPCGDKLKCRSSKCVRGTRCTDDTACNFGENCVARETNRSRCTKKARLSQRICVRKGCNKHDDCNSDYCCITLASESSSAPSRFAGECHALRQLHQECTTFQQNISHTCYCENHLTCTGENEAVDAPKAAFFTRYEEEAAAPPKVCQKDSVTNEC